MRTIFAQAKGEIIQGIQLMHPYAEWTIAWNKSHSNTLGCWSIERLTDGPADDQQILVECFNYAKERTVRSQADIVESFCAAPHIVDRPCWERHISIGTPWRRGDVMMACDLLDLIHSRSDNMAVKDEFAIWPNRDFSRFQDPMEKITKYLRGMKLDPEDAHPDANDYLKND